MLLGGGREGLTPIQPRKSDLVGLIRLLGVLITLLKDLDKSPHISACKVKENNSGLLSEVSVRIISQHKHELGYTTNQETDTHQCAEGL